MRIICKQSSFSQCFQVRLCSLWSWGLLSQIIKTIMEQHFIITNNFLNIVVQTTHPIYYRKYQTIAFSFWSNVNVVSRTLNANLIWLSTFINIINESCEHYCFLISVEAGKILTELHPTAIKRTLSEYQLAKFNLNS